MELQNGLMVFISAWQQRMHLEVTAPSVGTAPGLCGALNPESRVLALMLLAASFVAVTIPLLLLSTPASCMLASRSHYTGTSALRSSRAAE